MSLPDQASYKLALQKTANWQLLLLLAMGLFYLGVVLLVLGEMTTSYYRGDSFYFAMILFTLCLAWTGYIWSNLLRTVLAMNRFLRSEEEAHLLKAYQQQRLFWRNIGIIVGGGITLVAGIFLFFAISYGIR